AGRPRIPGRREQNEEPLQCTSKPFDPNSWPGPTRALFYRQTRQELSTCGLDTNLSKTCRERSKMIVTPWLQIVLKVVIMVGTMCSGVGIVRHNHSSGLTFGLKI